MTKNNPRALSSLSNYSGLAVLNASTFTKYFLVLPIIPDPVWNHSFKTFAYQEVHVHVSRGKIRIRIRKVRYVYVRNVSFSENCSNVLNE